MVPNLTYDEYAYRIGDENRTAQLDQVDQADRTGDGGRLRTNRFDTKVKRGASANIVETPDGDVVIVDSDYNFEKLESEIDARLGEDGSLHIISTHDHKDHTNNNDKILDFYDVETHYVPPKHRADGHLDGEDVKLHQANDTELIEVASGDEFTIGGASFEIDHPPREPVEETSLGSDTNENSLGVTVGYADSATPDPAVADYTARFNGDKLAAGQRSEWHRHTEKFEEREVDDTERPHHGDTKAADPEYRAAEGAQYEYINAPLYDKSNSHPNIDSFEVYDEDDTIYWSSLHGDFHHDGEGLPAVEHEFSTDPQDLKTVRQRVEGMKAEEPENTERYDSRFDERSDQYDPKADNPVEELRTVLDEKTFEQIYNQAEQIAETDVGGVNQANDEAVAQSPEPGGREPPIEQFQSHEEIQDLNKKLQGRDEQIQKLKDENSTLKDENLDLREENLDLQEENLNLQEENLDLREEIQDLRENVQGIGNARESDVEKATTTDRDRDEERDAAGAVSTIGGNDDPPSAGAAAIGDEEDTKGTVNEAETAGAMTNGDGADASSSSASLTESEPSNESTPESEQTSDSGWVDADPPQNLPAWLDLNQDTEQTNDSNSKWLGPGAPEHLPSWMEQTDESSTKERESGLGRNSETDRDRDDDGPTPGGLG